MSVFGFVLLVGIAVDVVSLVAMGYVSGPRA